MLLSSVKVNTEGSAYPGLCLLWPSGYCRPFLWKKPKPICKAFISANYGQTSAYYGHLFCNFFERLCVVCKQILLIPIKYCCGSFLLLQSFVIAVMTSYSQRDRTLVEKNEVLNAVKNRKHGETQKEIAKWLGVGKMVEGEKKITDKVGSISARQRH